MDLSHLNLLWERETEEAAHNKKEAKIRRHTVDKKYSVLIMHQHGKKVHA